MDALQFMIEATPKTIEKPLYVVSLAFAERLVDYVNKTTTLSLKTPQRGDILHFEGNEIKVSLIK